VTPEEERENELDAGRYAFLCRLAGRGGLEAFVALAQLDHTGGDPNRIDAAIDEAIAKEPTHDRRGG
jgi:hypothetical protein